MLVSATAVAVAVSGAGDELAVAGSVAVFVGALSLVGRLARSSHPARIALTPVLAVAVLQLVAAVLLDATQVLGLVVLLSTPVFCIAFVAGLMRTRRTTAEALARLGAGFGSRGAVDLRAVIAEAVGDPSLELVYGNHEDPDGWATSDGEHAAPPQPREDRRVTEVHGSHGRVAVLVYDAALENGSAVTAAAGGFALMALDNERLEIQLSSSLDELRSSRARILSAADRERRRIERDLHDGAQQRLVGLGIQLELVGELVQSDPDRATRRLRELSHEVDEAVEEVRSLAHGLVPPLLVERGLPDALRDAAEAGALRVTVHADRIGRYAPEIEGAVYFCCLEALQNAAKHATGARAVAIALRHDDALCFEVRDDGAGLPVRHHEGMGLVNMRDRIGAVGGRLRIESAPGGGTVVAGEVPVRTAAVAQEDCLAVYRPALGAGGAVVDFLIEHVNEAACLELGGVREELVGRRLGELDRVRHASANRGWLRDVLDRGVPRRAADVCATPVGDRLVVTWPDASALGRGAVLGPERAQRGRAHVALAEEGGGPA